MTEYELVDITANLAQGGISAISLYFTIITAYMIAAFVIGTRLTKNETVMISIIFIAAALFFVYVTGGVLFRQAYFVERLAEIETDTVHFAGVKMIVTIASIQLLGILISLKFMWDVRHRKIE
jgi:hypothetical protein